MNTILTTISQTSLLEWMANFFTVGCVILAGRNNIHTWWTGLVGCILYGVLFFQSKLYADTTLQVFFFITGVIGWMNWGGKLKNITTTSTSAKQIYFGISVLVAIGYGFLLKTFTDAYAPFVDSFVLTFSVVAQLMLLNRKIENWVVWIVVNTISVPLYWNRELYLSSIVYTIFWFNAWVGLYTWWNEYKNETV